MLKIDLILYIFSQEIYGDNSGIYKIKIYKEMLTPNHGCFGATYKLTCSQFALLVMFFLFILPFVQLYVLLIL